MLKQILADHNDDDTGELHDEITRAIDKLENGEDVEIADLVDKFSDVRIQECRVLLEGPLPLKLPCVDFPLVILHKTAE